MKSILIMVLGLPGVGKSYFARQFAQAINGVHINSDLIRRQSIQHPTYSSEEKSKVYAQMFNVVSQLLRQDRMVVVDATFSKKEHRLHYYSLVEKQKVELRLIKIEADEVVVKERLKVERPDSDADYAVYQKIKEDYDPIDQSCLVLNSTELTIEQMIEKAKEYIGFIT